MYARKKKAKRKSSPRGRKKSEIREIIYFCKILRVLDIAASKY